MRQRLVLTIVVLAAAFGAGRVQTSAANLASIPVAESAFSRSPEPTREPVPQSAPIQAPQPQPAPQPVKFEIPTNTIVTIRMVDGVDSGVNHTGEIFHAALDAPLMVGDRVVVPKGTDLYVRLAGAKSAGHIKGKSELHLELLKMDFRGRSYALVSSTYSLSGTSRAKSTAKKVGGGAVLGAVIGGIAGGGAGAAIGAGVGAGVGTVYSGATRGKQVQIPAETKLDFQLEQPLAITVMPRSTTPARLAAQSAAP